LAVIVTMLGTTPHQQQKAKADSSSTQLLPNTGPSSRSITEAYSWFLELPVPVVLAVLWLVGVVLLGTVVIAAYSAEVLLLAAVAIL
jgi:hypothetical protein